MVHRSWLAVTTLALAAWPDRGLAERKTAQVTVTGDVAATDNVFGTTQDRNEADVYLTFRPGLLLGYHAPRMTQEARIEGEMLEYLANSDAPSLGLRTNLSSAFVPSKFTTFSTQLNASSGQLSSLSGRSSPFETSPEVLPLGRIDTQQADASTYFSWSSGTSYSLSNNLFASASRSDDNADDLGATEPTIITSLTAGGGFSLDRSFRRGDALSLHLGASVLRLERDAPPDAMLGPKLDRQINPRAHLQWRHDINRVWSTSIDAGVVYVYPYGVDPDNPTAELRDDYFPVVGLTAAYTQVWGRAQLLIRRDVTPNLLLARNTISDAAIATAALPLPWLDKSRRRAPRFAGLGSVGVNRTRLIEPETSDIESEFWVGRLDVGIGYSPRPGFTYGLRYEFVYQTGDDAAVLRVPGYFRNTLSFTFSIRYPDVGVEPRRANRSTRADGSDLVPVGVDPATTEMFDSPDADSGE